MKVWSSPHRRRWLLWAILATSFLLVNVYRLSTAVIADALMIAFQTTGSQLGTIHAVFFVVYAAMQIPTGVLVDRIGPRITASTGAAVMNGGAIWFALAESYRSAMAGRLLIGLGASVIFVSMLRLVANWYRTEELGLMNGLCFSVGGLGGILATTPFAILVNAAGWRRAIVGMAAVGLAVSIATVLFVRDSPKRAGLEPIEGVPEQARLSGREIRRFLSTVLRDRWVWVVAVLLFGTGGVNLTLFGLWGIPYVVQVYGTSVTVASTLTLLGGVGMMIGPPAIGRLSDYTGRRTELVVAGGVVYTATLAVIAATGNPPLPVVGLAFLLSGITLGAFVLTFAIVQERHADRAGGIAVGTINGASFVGAATFPSLMGYVLDAYWTGEVVGGVRVYTITGYRVAFALAAATGVVAVGCGLWIHLRADDREPDPTGAPAVD